MKFHLRAAFAVAPMIALSACTSTLSPSVEPSVTASAADSPAPVLHEQNERVPEGGAWTEHYFGSTDEVELHADVVLPEGLAPGEAVPVILSVGPYFGHSGMISVEGYEETGPAGVYSDLIEEAGLLERGYGLVMVDLRGYGGSTGCSDLLGPGEQADVRAALDWVAGQPGRTARSACTACPTTAPPAWSAAP